ncbi:MAG TPA: hypothetical protein VNN62_00745 [Methylomirabilota bacterium]|jgi:hypothetical protein|nr:hypothetical protein [Methylomirabilota bacterium]
MARAKKLLTPDKPLPAEFQDLAPFVEWALGTETERMTKRMTSSMKEIRAFYDAMLARMDAIVHYLKQFPADDLPPEARTLFHLSLSLIEVSNAVELYKQPKLPFGFDPARFVPRE